MADIFSGLYRDKRVLVTGHTGFKGSWLCEWLLELGAKVAGFSNGVPYSPCHFDILDLRSRVKHFEGDVRNLSDLVSTFDHFRPEIVFHLAAQSLVRQSFDEPKVTIETNAIGSLNVLEAVRKTPSVKAAVMITSDKCYQNVGWDFGYRETDALGGKDPYSASKACAEIIAYTYVQSFFQGASATQIATVRAGNVIGGGDWAPNRIVPDCMKAWSENKPAKIRNPEHTRPWQHVLEPLSGYLWTGCHLFNRNPQIHGEAFNFGPIHGNNQSVLALVTEMKKNWDAVSWEFLPSDKPAAIEAPLLQLNCDKAFGRMQWRPTLTYEEGIRLTVDWYKGFYGSASGKPKTKDQIQFFAAKAVERRLRWAAA